jgi:sugar-specific transcriptional regulator TrmB
MVPVFMRNLSEDWEVLDLTDAESKILWALIELGTMSVSKTAREANVARTTVDAALRRLQERKLVRKIKSKGHVSLWKAVRSDRVKNEFLEAAQQFDRGVVKVKEQEVVGGIDAEEIGITVFRGKQQIMHTIEQMLNLSQAERVWFIQGNKSAERSLEFFDKDYVREFQKIFKKKKIIMEGVNGERVKELFKKVDRKTQETSYGRMTISSLLPDKYMEFDVDLLIIRDSVMFFDMKNEIVVIIKNEPIVEMLRSVSQFLKDNGTVFNINEYIKEILEDKMENGTEA